MSNPQTNHGVLEEHWEEEGEPRGPLSELEQGYYVRRPDDDCWFKVSEVVKLPGWAVVVVRPPSSGDVNDVATIKGGSLREFPMLTENLNNPLGGAYA